MFEIFSMHDLKYFVFWYFSYCLFYYITSRSILKEKHWSITIGSSIIALIYLIVKYWEKSFLICAITIIAVILTTILIKKDRPFKIIGYYTIVNFLLIGTGFILATIFVTLLGDKYKTMYSNLEVYQDYIGFYYISIICIITFALFFGGLLKLIIAKRNHFLEISLKYVFFLWTPLTHLLFFLMFFGFFLRNAAESISFTKISIIFGSFVFVFDIITFLVVEKFEKVERENRQYQEELFKYQIDYQQTLLLRENQKEIRKMRHDMLNILSTADGFIDIQKYDKASGILKNATNDLSSLKGVSICSNETLNTILSIKMNHATEKGITLNFKITENSPISIDDYSLCRIIGNLTDNAINAVTKTNGDVVNISIEITPETLTIITENKFDAKEDKAITKNKNRGQGKSIIRDIVKKFDGSYNCEIDGELYKTTTVLANIKPDKVNA